MLDADFSGVSELTVEKLYEDDGVVDGKEDVDGVEDVEGSTDSDIETVGVIESVGIDGFGDVDADCVCVFSAVETGEVDDDTLGDSVSKTVRVKVANEEKVAADVEVSEPISVAAPLALIVEVEKGDSDAITVVDMVDNGEAVEVGVALPSAEIELLAEFEREVRGDIDDRALTDDVCVDDGILDELRLPVPERDGLTLFVTLVDDVMLRDEDVEIDGKMEPEEFLVTPALDEPEILATDRDADGDSDCEFDCRGDRDRVALVEGPIESDDFTVTDGDRERLEEGLAEHDADERGLTDAFDEDDTLVVAEILEDGDEELDGVTLKVMILAVADTVAAEEELPRFEKVSHRDTVPISVADIEAGVEAEASGLRDDDTDLLAAPVADADGEFVDTSEGKGDVVGLVDVERVIELQLVRDERREPVADFDSTGDDDDDDFRSDIVGDRLGLPVSDATEVNVLETFDDDETDEEPDTVLDTFGVAETRPVEEVDVEADSEGVADGEKEVCAETEAIDAEPEILRREVSELISDHVTVALGATEACGDIEISIEPETVSVATIVAETLNEKIADSDCSTVVVTVDVIEAWLILGTLDGDEMRDDEAWADADADGVVDSLMDTETDWVPKDEPEIDG